LCKYMKSIHHIPSPNLLHSPPSSQDPPILYLVAVLPFIIHT
jgi:hypothetical protein